MSKNLYQAASSSPWPDTDDEVPDFEPMHQRFLRKGTRLWGSWEKEQEYFLCGRGVDHCGQRRDWVFQVVRSKCRYSTIHLIHSPRVWLATSSCSLTLLLPLNLGWFHLEFINEMEMTQCDIWGYILNDYATSTWFYCDTWSRGSQLPCKKSNNPKTTIEEATCRCPGRQFQMNSAF